MSYGFDPATLLQMFASQTPPNYNIINGKVGENRTINDQLGPIFGDLSSDRVREGDVLGNPMTTNDIFAGTSANEDFLGLASESFTTPNGQAIQGANIYMGGGGHNRYFVGPGITAAQVAQNPQGGNWTEVIPGSNDIVVIDEFAEGANKEELFLQGVRDPQAMQDSSHLYYDPQYSEEQNAIANHYRVGDRDYRIDYANGYSTYIVNFLDTQGQPMATIHYDDCDPLVPNLNGYQPPQPPVYPPVQPPVYPPQPPIEPPVYPPVEPPIYPPQPPVCPPAEKNNVCITINNESNAISNSQVFTNTSGGNKYNQGGAHKAPFEWFDISKLQINQNITNNTTCNSGGGLTGTCGTGYDTSVQPTPYTDQYQEQSQTQDSSYNANQGNSSNTSTYNYNS